MSEARLVKRNNWLNEFIHRDLYERVRLNRNHTEGARFLEREFLKDVFYQLEHPKPPEAVRMDLDDKGFQSRSEALRKAIAFVESHLFDNISISRLAKAAGASESTLLRLFQREFGCAPGRYVLNRRLDEAQWLLANGRYSIG